MKQSKITNRKKDYIFKSQYLPLINKIKKLEMKKDKLKKLLTEDVMSNTEYNNFKITLATRTTINYNKFIEDNKLEIPKDYYSHTKYTLIYSK